MPTVTSSFKKIYCYACFLLAHFCGQVPNGFPKEKFAECWSIFSTNWMSFLLSKQQCQSTEGQFLAEIFMQTIHLIWKHHSLHRSRQQCVLRIQ